MNKKLGKLIFKNSLVFSVYLFLLEIVVRINTYNNIIDWPVLRILVSSFIIGTTFGLFLSLFNKKTNKILSTIFSTLIALYTWGEINLYNYLGFFMGIGNAEQGTKITDYVKDYLASAQLISVLVVVPLILYLFYVWFLNDFLKKKKLERTTYFVYKKEKISHDILAFISTLFIIFGLIVGYYYSLDVAFMQNKLQAIKNSNLIRTSDNSNLSVSQFGLFTYGLSDIAILTFNIEPNEVEIIANNDDIIKVENDYTRTIDDEAWEMVIENETSQTLNKLNNYFINREITSKNEYTGLFENKNLIVILMESVNMISINEKEYPTIYKLYSEGISFQNNYSPRNNCSTGNNEMTVMTSLFTINNTCTANKYRKNVYPEAIFNVFKNAGYNVTSYHDYIEAYYYRTVIHPNMGSMKYSNAIDLKIRYNSVYEEWPSDVDLIEKATPLFINEDHFMAFLTTVTPHQPYTVSSEYGDKHLSEFSDYNYSKAVKRYMSKLKELDKALELLLQKLEENDKLDDTVIALFCDHYPYGLTNKQINEVLDYDVTVNKEVDRTPMIIYNSELESMKIDKYTSLIDLLPTLFNLFNMDYDPRLYLGTDIFSDNLGKAVFADGSWQDEKGYYNATKGKFIPFDIDNTYTDEELIIINNEINTRQKMSALAIQNNYFNYLNKQINKYQMIIDEQNVNILEGNDYN